MTKTKTTPKKKPGRRPSVRRCAICNAEVDLSRWCYGCRNNVCAKCDIGRQMLISRAPHTLEDHRRDPRERVRDTDIPF